MPGVGGEVESVCECDHAITLQYVRRATGYWGRLEEFCVLPLGFWETFTSAEHKAALKFRIKVNKKARSSLGNFSWNTKKCTEKQRFGGGECNTCCHSVEDMILHFLASPPPQRWSSPQLPGVTHCSPLNISPLIRGLLNKPAGSPSNPAVRCNFSRLHFPSHWFTPRVILVAWLCYWGTLLNKVVYRKTRIQAGVPIFKNQSS